MITVELLMEAVETMRRQAALCADLRPLIMSRQEYEDLITVDHGDHTHKVTATGLGPARWKRRTDGEAVPRS